MAENDIATKLTELSKVFNDAGVRTLLTDDKLPVLGVWRNPNDRYAADVITYRHSRTTGGAYSWGDRWQYGAPETATPEMVVAMFLETME